MVAFKNHLKPMPVDRLAMNLALEMAKVFAVPDPLFAGNDSGPAPVDVAAGALRSSLDEDRRRCVNFFRSRIATLYKALGADEGQCKSCGAPIWWVLMPSGKPAPFTRDGLNHFGDCKSADQHRKDSR